MKASHPSYKMDSVVRQPSNPSGVPVSTKQLCKPDSTAPRNHSPQKLPDQARQCPTARQHALFRPPLHFVLPSVLLRAALNSSSSI